MNEIELAELKELIEIRKELQNIRAILEYKFVEKYEGVRTVDENGKSIRILRPLEDPLGKIRKECNIDW